MGCSRKEDIWSATEKRGNTKAKTNEQKTPGNERGRSTDETLRPWYNC